MVVIRNIFITILSGYMFSACSPTLPVWQHDARVVFERVRIQGAERFMPDEFKNFKETLSKGEDLLLENESEEADKFFHLAWTKGNLLELHLAAEKSRLAEADRQRSEAVERERQNALQAEQMRLSRLNEEAAKITEIEIKNDKTGQKNEKTLPPYHTVMRGETLPQIAARSDIYNDQALWPLIYRANRDQIRDPAHIWPGQSLRIPRNLSREEIAEARRYGQERPIR